MSQTDNTTDGNNQQTQTQETELTELRNKVAAAIADDKSDDLALEFLESNASYNRDFVENLAQELEVAQ